MNYYINRKNVLFTTIIALFGIFLQIQPNTPAKAAVFDANPIQTDSFNTAGAVALVLCCVFLVVSLLLWLILGRDKDVIDIVEFYPPDGLNCGEMAYAYYGSLRNKDLVPMILGLAAKGYIAVEQTDGKGTKFVFHLLRGYTGVDEAEKEFMEGLLQYGSVVTKIELENSFYKTLDRVNDTITKMMKPKIFIEKTLIWRLLALVFALIPYMVGLYGITRFYHGSTVMGILFPAVVYGCVTAFFILATSKKSGIAGGIAFSIFGIAAVWVVVAVLGGSLNYGGLFYWVVFFACIVANLFQVLFYRIIDKRTDYGIDLLGRIRGFRNYLMTAKRPHLVSLMEQDPAYFYKILPYTYVFGIPDTWAEQFDGIVMNPPDWYYGTTFNFHFFTQFMNRTMQTTQTAMTSNSNRNGLSGRGDF